MKTVLELLISNFLDYRMVNGIKFIQDDKFHITLSYLMYVVSSVFGYLFINFKFLGTIEFLVSIWIQNIQILPPFVPCKISRINL